MISTIFTKRFLLCDPKYYGVSYSINPWMHLNNKPHSKLAWQQWDQLRQTIIRLGGWIDYIQPHDTLPDMVFTANAGLVYKDKFVLSNFKHKQRCLESAFFNYWFLSKFDVYEIEHLFEGAGDALFWGDTLFMGHGFRTEQAAAKEIELIVEKDVIPIKLVDEKFYHLDTCFCPINQDVALAYPGAFDRSDYEQIKSRGQIIEVNREDAIKFACNSVAIGPDLIMPDGCDELLIQMKDYPWIKVHQVPMTEFIKAGGACKCLTIELPREI